MLCCPSSSLAMRRSQISRPSTVGSTISTLWMDLRQPFQQMLERHLQRITEKRYQHMGLHPHFHLMEQGPNGQLAFERAECRFHFCQLQVLLPEIGSTVRTQIRA